MNIKQELENAIKRLRESNIEEPILKAKIILAHVLQKNKEYLLIHETEELDVNNINKYKHEIEKICNHIPLQYITNKQEFMGLDFYVDENVLIPQPDTEILVEEAIDICRKLTYLNINKNINILDLCTGSGAIGISIAKNIKNSEITLLDISKNALDVAKENCIKNGFNINANSKEKINIIESDLFEKLNKNSKFDIIISNPPYIKTDVIKTLDKQVQNEPIIALDGGNDGLNIYRRIINEAFEFLNKDGYLCLEIGYDQKEDVIELIKNSKKYYKIYSKKDLAGNDRIIICQKEN